MKRLIISVAIFISAGILSWYSLVQVLSISSETIEKTDEIIAALEAEDMQNVLLLSEELFDMWNENCYALELYINHNTLQIINEHMAMINAYAKNGSMPEVYASAHYVKLALTLVQQDEIPSWHSIM